MPLPGLRGLRQDRRTIARAGRKREGESVVRRALVHPCLHDIVAVRTEGDDGRIDKHSLRALQLQRLPAVAVLFGGQGRALVERPAVRPGIKGPCQQQVLVVLLPAVGPDSAGTGRNPARARSAAARRTETGLRPERRLTPARRPCGFALHNTFLLSYGNSACLLQYATCTKKEKPAARNARDKYDVYIFKVF